MAVRDGRGDVKQTTTGFRGPLMVQSLTSAKSKFLSLAKSKFLSLSCYINRILNNCATKLDFFKYHYAFDNNLIYKLCRNYRSL